MRWEIRAVVENGTAEVVDFYRWLRSDEGRPEALTLESRAQADADGLMGPLEVVSLALTHAEAVANLDALRELAAYARPPADRRHREYAPTTEWISFAARVMDSMHVRDDSNHGCVRQFDARAQKAMTASTICCARRGAPISGRHGPISPK